MEYFRGRGGVYVLRKSYIPSFFNRRAYKENLGKMPDTLVADAGYGSEENYEYLENNDVGAFVKYQYFHKEQSKK